MFLWMTYVMAVSLFLAASAWAAERAARVRHSPTRWIWALALCSSLVMPTIIASVSIQMPTLYSPAVSREAIALRDATSRLLAPQRLFAADAQTPGAWIRLDLPLKTTWLLMSAGIWVALIANGLYLFSHKRRWSTATLAGISVHVAPDAGPAVVGLLRPIIVLPRWLLTAPPEQQNAVMAHEQSHLAAGDTRLFTAALCLLILMPWNLPLWWQLRRLRHAIEVDCDRRVLRTGCDAAAYGETLIVVAERHGAYIGTVAAMSESKSLLEQRISIMTNTYGRWRLATVIALSGLSAALVAVAAQVSPPDAPNGSGSPHQEVAVDPGVLARYVGSYNMDDHAVLTIALEGNQLMAQLTGQSAFPIFPMSTTEFFYKVVDAQITFADDPRGQATSLVLHQNGQNLSMARIDPAKAARLEADRTAKIQNQTPTAGSEAALRRMIAAIASGKPNYEEMSAELADATRSQLPKLKDIVSTLGEVQSVQFLGVGNMGWDTYQVKQERGAMQWRIAMSADGKIAGALVSSGP